MIKKTLVAGLFVAPALLTGCIVVDEEADNIIDQNDVEAIAANANAALQTCGEGNVAKVDASGFRCKSTD
ncbi:MAG: hypothetical protein AAFQ67_09420 [Pseudomonadota bacterium]